MSKYCPKPDKAVLEKVTNKQMHRGVGAIWGRGYRGVGAIGGRGYLGLDNSGCVSGQK